MKQIVKYIEDNHISEEEVAQAAHMSLRNFRRQIHSKDRMQARIVLLLADKKSQSIDNVIKLRNDEPSRYYCLDGIFI